jgi:predicted nucleotidyltransferase
MNAHPTPYAELNAVLAELTESVQDILGVDCLAVWLQGSFAVGDADEHSDVDFLVVTRHELTDAQVQTLQAMHQRIYDLDSEWAKHLEGSYIPQALLNQADAVNVQKFWYIDNGSRVLEQSVHCNTWVVRWSVREHGITLAGAEPEALLDPVSPETLREEVGAVIRDWGELLIETPETMNPLWYQCFAVLSYCRMLQTLETGKILSKRAAVEWAADNIEPHWQELIQKAWAARSNGWQNVHATAALDDVRQTREFIRYAIERAKS